MNQYDIMAPYRIPTLNAAITEGSYAQNKLGFIQASISASQTYIDVYKYTTDITYGVSITESTHPTWEGIWPDRNLYDTNKAVFRVKELVPGKDGYITLEVKASPKYLY